MCLHKENEVCLLAQAGNIISGLAVEWINKEPICTVDDENPEEVCRYFIGNDT